MTDRQDSSYGLVAAFFSVLLLWFGIWTVLCNTLVIAGTSYRLLIWCFPATVLVTVLTAIPLVPRVLASYSSFQAPFKSFVDPLRVNGTPKPLVAVGLLGLSFIAALIGARFQSVAFLLVSISGLSFLVWRFLPALPVSRVSERMWLNLGLLFLLICGLYYFGHWMDWDDANYINLAVGAQQTKGLVFQYDTMLGDGPGPVHLGTYRFHSFELLGAVISSLTGVTPIVALHLIVPLPILAALALLLLLVFKPLVGVRWIGCSLFALAFLYGVTETYGTWGVHGVIRFFQGKGLLITVLVPVSVALTVRWFLRREKLDLLGLAICHVCAIGASANGLYLTPVASAFAATALILASPIKDWRRTVSSSLWLAPTICYSVVLALVGAQNHFYQPSEVTEVQQAYSSFRFVTGWSFAGLAAITILPFAALGFIDPRLRVGAALYVPLLLFLTLNPLGWAAASAATGNLGFRFIWAMPAAILAGLVLDGVCRHIVGSRTRVGIAVAALFLFFGISYNAWVVDRPYRTIWRMPGLKVVPEDYRQAQTIAKLAPPGCNVLAPERVAVWLATMPGAPNPAFVRSLYLRHYRFTMRAEELALRWRLFDLIEAEKDGVGPKPSELSAVGIHLGLIAVGNSPIATDRAASLAQTLGLRDRGTVDGKLSYWRGPCQS